MSWETERLEKAKQIIEMYPQKRSALGPPPLLSTRQRWIYF